tara:strand:+ start:3080 stop:3880 length:801 start_codon:yes stop_codon:yes gene_type:complete
MKKYYFIAGLHRSGATLLSSILNQNPRFYSGPLTPVLDIMRNIESNIPTIEHYKSSPKPISAHKIISSVIGNYYHDIDCPVIFDKNRDWPRQINYIEQYIGQRAKIICPVRDISEILTSFLTLIHKTYDGINFNVIDIGVIEKEFPLTDYNRCDFILNTFLGNAMRHIEFALDNNLLDRILFVEYKDLVSNPYDTMNSIYNFLGEDIYDHDFDHIQNNNQVEDIRYYNLPGLHDIRSKIEYQSKDPKEVLPKEILERCRGMEFWRD